MMIKSGNTILYPLLPQVDRYAPLPKDQENKLDLPAHLAMRVGPNLQESRAPATNILSPSLACATSNSRMTSSSRQQVTEATTYA